MQIFQELGKLDSLFPISAKVFYRVQSESEGELLGG